MLTYQERVGRLQGSEELIFKLVCQRATPNQWAEWLRVPLEHAAVEADHELVDTLLRAGAGHGIVGWRGCYGKTLLDAAAIGGSEKVVKCILNAGAWPDIDAQTTDKKKTALTRAAALGHADAARTLMLANADVNISDCKGWTPLHASLCGVKSLMFDKSAREKLACDLLLNGARLDAKTPTGIYPIHLAARQGLDDIVQACLCRGIDINMANTKGKAPLHMAVENGRVSTSKLLLAAGADVDGGDNSRNTSLHLAAAFDRVDITQALLEAGADINARNCKEETPLHRAAAKGSSSSMPILLQNGADVHAQNTSGFHPLHYACMWGTAMAADLLLRWGADEMAVNTEIMTAHDEKHPEFEALTRLLERAPQDRAWRRRGFLVLCRAYPNRLSIDSLKMRTDKAMGLHERSSKLRREEVAREDGDGGESTCGSFADVAGWLVKLGEEIIFCHIVAYL